MLYKKDSGEVGQEIWLMISIYIHKHLAIILEKGH